MNARRIVGLILVVMGVVIMLWGGVFWRDRDTLFKAGSVEITAEQRKGVSLPPLLGAAGVIAGVVLLVIPQRSRV
jgi:hypothetical protein